MSQRQSQPDSRWFKGLTGKAKDERLKDIQSFSRAFEELDKLLTSLLKEPNRDYGPGWDIKQVAVLEYNQALKDFRALLKVN